jgi:UDP-N-acetylglucosamine--dolichyl-phosphate N-acetylglucosaminephosphotransferase
MPTTKQLKQQAKIEQKRKRLKVFPKVPDQHKNGKPLVPNGLGVIYVLFTTVYLFLLYFLGLTENPSTVSAPLTLAVCILFGGFMGLLDDWMDLKWRYKAFMPLIAALPLIYFAASNPAVRTSISLPFIGMIDFGPTLYFYVIIPVIVMIVTNAVNMLGGFNGLESICPAIVILGLMACRPSLYLLMLGPIIFWLILAGLNLIGKIFVGNSGSFAIGMTIASFAVIADVKLGLAISILPYIFNSSLILLMVFFTRKKAQITFKDGKLQSDHRRSLVTTIAYHRSLTERQVVLIVSAIVAVFTLLAVIIALLNLF